MPLNTVQDYITSARTLLQDEAAVKRYTDPELAEALGFALLEARAKRPELFMGRMDALPDINRATPLNTALDFEPMYRLALVFFMVGHVALRDEEESAKADAAGYLNRFVAKLLSIAS